MPVKEKAPATKTPVRAVPIGADVDALIELRDKKRKLEASIKDIEGQASLIEERLMESMDKNGVDKATGKLGTVSITSNVVANVEDWDLFYPYIAKNKFWHLLQKRVSDPAYRELLEAGKKVPGVQPFTKKKLNLRSAT